MGDRAPMVAMVKTQGFSINDDNLTVAQCVNEAHPFIKMLAKQF
ncbi:hypothetical protein [Celerinatantimonas yamalensis]|uniref:Uncharacterized protein n=1 Tax=Celerinatantimonas yamalensis TaxID=559956 RepID=A0ABW9G6P3_9GAMM